jgi:hypothetical protein
MYRIDSVVSQDRRTRGAAPGRQAASMPQASSSKPKNGVRPSGWAKRAGRNKTEVATSKCLPVD